MFKSWKTQLSVVVLVGLMLGTFGPALTAFAAQTPVSTSGSVQVGTLSEEEIAGLLYMREEEKLAHDVYMTLYDLWGLPLFQNIASSETVHTETIRALIENYGLADPAAGNAVGVFNNADLQALYDQLVAQGSESLEAALRVGAAIEEIDILDLQERLEATTAADIRLAYENLMDGSGNHLRAFVGTLESQTGVTYQPQYLAQEAYAAIMAGQGGGMGQSQALGQAQGQGMYAQGTTGQGAYGQGAQGANGRGRGAGGRGRGAQGGQVGAGQTQQAQLYSQGGTGTCLQY